MLTQAPGDISVAPLQTGAKTYAGGTAEAGDRTIVPSDVPNTTAAPGLISSSVIDDAMMRQLCAMDVRIPPPLSR